MIRYLETRDRCPACRGRGWQLLKVNDWPIACPTCRGEGRSPTLARLAKILDERRDTMTRLDRVQLGPKVAARLLDKLVDFISRGEA